MENKHKYQIQVPFIEPVGNQSVPSVNYSKTLGSSDSWIGCGYIDRQGKSKSLANVSFPYFSLVLVLDGKGNYIDEQGREYYLGKGSVFLRKPGYRHSSHCESLPAWKEVYLDCDRALYEHLASFLIPEQGAVVFQTSAPLEAIEHFVSFMDFVKKASEQDIPGIYIKFVELLGYIFTKSTNDEEQHENDMINHVKLALDDNCHQRIDLKLYCDELGLNYEAFRKEFKEQTGISLMKYIVRCRLDKACTLLRTTNLRISEISNQLGYSSQYEFSNQFKRYFNLSPRQYKQGIN